MVFASAKLIGSMSFHPSPLWFSRVKAPSKRIGLLGLFGIGNLGNDGSMEAMLLFLRRTCSQAELICICPQPEKIGNIYQASTLPFGSSSAPSRWFAAVDRLFMGVPRGAAAALQATKRVRHLDLLIIPGTGALDDFATGPRGWPIGLFAWCLAAKLRGVKVAFVSIGAGPIPHPVSRWLMKSAARMASYRSYRDTVSKDFMQSIGFDVRDDAIYPDIAFKLPGPQPSKALEGTRPLVVGVGVMTYFGWRGSGETGAAIYASYRQKITQFVLWLLDQGYRVRILMGEETDQRAVDDLLDSLAMERPGYSRNDVIAEPVHSLHDLMRQIAQVHVVVATRFHNIVCALKLGKPTISIGYAKKNDALMAEMGVGQFCQHIEELDVHLLVEQFEQLLSDREAYERKIREINLVFAERLARQEQILSDRVLGS